MREEILSLQDAVHAVARLLRSGALLTREEDAAVGSAVGKIRTELNLWRRKQRKKSKEERAAG
jgi:hypothetical protein